MHIIDKKIRKVPIGAMAGWILTVTGSYFCIVNINLFIPIFKIIIFIIANLSMGMFFWKVYIKKNSSGNEILTEVSRKELTEYFQMDAATIDKLQTKKVIVVHYLDEQVHAQAEESIQRKAV